MPDFRVIPHFHTMGLLIQQGRPIVLCFTHLSTVRWLSWRCVFPAGYRCGVILMDTMYLIEDLLLVFKVLRR